MACCNNNGCIQCKQREQDLADFENNYKGWVRESYSNILEQRIAELERERDELRRELVTLAPMKSNYIALQSTLATLTEALRNIANSNSKGFKVDIEDYQELQAEARAALAKAGVGAERGI